jgi:hypothetical protein
MRVVRLADGAGGAGLVDLINPKAGGLRFAADGSIVHGQSFFVDSLCGDDLADGRTAKSAFATMDAAIMSLRASPGKDTTVFVRVGQAHRMLPREASDPLADWPLGAVRPWQPELDEKEKLDSRGCPFNEEILIGISASPGSTAVRFRASGSRSLRLQAFYSHLSAHECFVTARRSERCGWLGGICRCRAE